MRKVKLVSVFVLLILLLSAGSGVTLAQEPPPPGVNPASDVLEQYQELFERYGIVEAGQVPFGITPLRVNSPGELERLITTFLNGKRVDVSDQFCVDRLVNEGVLSAGGAPNGVLYYTTVRRECTQNTGFSTFYTAADIRIGIDGSFRWIDSVNEWVGLRGVTVGQELVHTYHYHHTTAIKADITGGGIVNVYLLINGGILIFSYPVECSIHYSLY